MKTFTNANARTLQDAVGRAREAHREQRATAFVGGGSDLLALVKERVISPDLLVSLKTIPNLNQVSASASGTTIGGQTTLSTVAGHAQLARDYAVLTEAAVSVATPQIRNLGTLAGNVCQRPWCWYFRNGFPCYKAGGNQCFSYAGENQHHAIFGGGPSYIVHPSDTAPALVALEATFEIVGPSGTRRLPAAEFFVLPRQKAATENVLGDEDVLASVHLPPAASGRHSSYFKVTDRKTWTHAVVSAAIVLDLEHQICRRARVVLGGVAPVPWRLPRVEELLIGQPITEELAARAAAIAVSGARPLSKNGYKVPMTRAAVRRTLLKVATLA